MYGEFLWQISFVNTAINFLSFVWQVQVERNDLSATVKWNVHCELIMHMVVIRNTNTNTMQISKLYVLCVGKHEWLSTIYFVFQSDISLSWIQSIYLMCDIRYDIMWFYERETWWYEYVSQTNAQSLHKIRDRIVLIRSRHCKFTAQQSFCINITADYALGYYEWLQDALYISLHHP